MISIAEIKEKLKKDKDLNSCLDLLIDYSLSNKTLIYNQDIDGIDFIKLKNAQIIKLHSGKFHIADFELFGFKVYSRFKSNCGTNLTNDFKAFVLLIGKIEAAYKSNKFVQDITTLFNNLWAIAILDTNQNLNIDFLKYLESLDPKKNRDEIFFFNEGYSSVLPFLNIDIPKFFKICNQLIKWTKSDADFNLPLGSLLKGVRNKIYSNSEWGLECFEYTINQTNIEVDFLTPLIAGLYDKLGMSFFNTHLRDKINNETYAVPIICGLSNIELVKNDDCELFFKVYNESKKDNTHILLNLPKLLFAILRSRETNIDNKHIEQTFKHLKELLNIDNPTLIYNILQENEYQESHLKLRQDLIIEFIKKPYFKQEYLNSINHFLWRIKDVSYFEKILYALGEFLPYKPVTKNLSTSIIELHSSYRKEFDKVIVNLLIQDKAFFRFLGTDIFRDVSQKHYTFDYDILELSSLNQYKLWVSIFQNYREPKSIIPCLMPLLKSKSSLVQEAFICKLEEYTESYSDSVTEILKEELDFADLDLKKVYERIKRHKDVFFQNNVNVKDGINELNPAFTQNKIFIEFNKSYHRHFSRQLQKSSDDNSFFLNFCSKVTLLKGGGWKIGGREEISKLGIISTSFSLPRGYFTRPEHFDFEASAEMTSNWTENSFAEIKRFLDHE